MSLAVVAYCRVSTDSNDQINSFESQKMYFREYIERNENWELYEIYSDTGITGTSTKNRTGFNDMIHDAENGKFSLIITKEVSRFSRNILDTIAYTRMLKDSGVGVIFMNDGIDTREPDSELRLSIMGSIAQEESRKTSSRVRWGQTRQMERGVVFGCSMLGYDVKNGRMTVNEQGAELVKLIFHKYGIEKKSTSVIAKELQNEGYPTASGNTEWNRTQIVKILRNEKYTGDLVQKKTCTADYLTHKRKYNHGEEEKVILRNHHEPIIDRELWNTVQAELARRSTHNKNTVHSARYTFSGKIRCGECGENFVSRRKYLRDGSSYLRWGCSSITKGKNCGVSHMLRDDTAQEMLKTCFLSLDIDRNDIKNEIIKMLPQEKYDHTRKERELERIKNKKTALLDAYFSQKITEDEMTSMKIRYDKAIEKLCENKDSTDKRPVSSAVESILTCGNEMLYKHLLDHITVNKDGTIEVSLKYLPQKWIFTLEKT